MTVAVGTLIAAVPVQPGREQGRRLLQDELARREYQEARPGPIQQALQWLFDQFGRLHYSGADPARPALTAVALTVVAAVLGYALYRSGGFRRAARRAAPAVLAGSAMTAEQHRALSERRAAAGDWDAAVVERFRAIALALEERAVLAPQPGRTAREVAAEAGAALPRHAAALDDAAGRFDRVSYGHRHLDEAAYAELAALDAALAASRTGPGGGRMSARLRAVRGPLVIGGVVLLAGLLVALLTPRASGTASLDPDNPNPDGARAVVQVLRRQGVEVRAATRSAPAVAASAGGTLLVNSAELLGPQQLSRLADSTAARLVLLAPPQEVLDRLLPGARAAAARRPGVAPPGCVLPEAVAAGAAASGGATYRGGASSGTSCYRGSLLAGRSPSGREVVVLGRPDLLANDTITDDGNAALALRLLGSRPALVWYTADPLEPAPGERHLTLTELLPAWVPFVGLQLALVVLAAMIWRGRRLGPLVGEPLPVVVRAAETQEGRARLYRQARARDRAAAGLRAASARRLARHLAAGSGTTAAQLVSMVAEATGRGTPSVSAILLGPAPGSDAELVRLADDLDDLERALTDHRKAPA